jgi:hypothetical protein
MRNYPDILLENTNIWYSIIFFSKSFLWDTENSTLKSCHSVTWNFREKFSFLFSLFDRVAIYHNTSRLARLSIDRLARVAGFSASISIRSGVSSWAKTRGRGCTRPSGPRALPAMHNYHDKLRRSVGVAQLSPNGSRVVRRCGRDSAFTHSKFVNVSRARSRNSQYRI